MAWDEIDLDRGALDRADTADEGRAESTGGDREELGSGFVRKLRRRLIGICPVLSVMVCSGWFLVSSRAGQPSGCLEWAWGSPAQDIGCRHRGRRGARVERYPPRDRKGSREELGR